MAKSVREKRYEFVSKRDGDRCFICGRKGSRDTLVVDHWDGNRKNNDPDNWRLLCQSDNIRKNPRQKAKYKINYEDIYNERRIMTEEMQVNRESEPRFRSWLFDQTHKNGSNPLEFNDAIWSGAEVAGCSGESIKRYLNKLLSRAGIYTVKEDDTGKRYIVFKEGYTTNGKRK